MSRLDGDGSTCPAQRVLDLRRAPRRRSRDGCAHRDSVATAPASMRAISRMF